MLKRIKKWKRRLENWWHPVDYRFELQVDIPKQISRKKIYLIGKPEAKWVAIFQCPCGCGESVYLNLLSDARPCWHFWTVGKKISFHPSIWQKNGCKSHYFIKDGRVKWI